MISMKELSESSTVAGTVGDTSEDGDFVVLRESRESRKSETFDILPTVFEKIFEPVVESRETRVFTRPQSGRNRKTATVGGDCQWAELVEAVASGPVAFKETLNKLCQEYKLTSSHLHNPHNNQNILHFALDHGDQDIVRAVFEKVDEDLIQESFKVDIMNIRGKKNVLHQVVEQNNLKLLKKLLLKISTSAKKIALLNKETCVEIKGQRPRTFPCLHLASYYGFKDIVTFILDEGVDVNHLNAKKDSALLWATRWGYVDTVRTLLARGALPGLENDKGSTALYWAVRYGHAETVDLLAREGRADVQQTRKLGLVAPIVLACALGYQKIVSILLEFKANPNLIIRGGERPIHHAGREGHASIIELLIQHGSDVDAADERGDTALILAAQHGRANALKTLLEYGAKVTHKNQMGEDVWTFAIKSDTDLILKLLVLHQRTTEEQYDNGPVNVSSAAAGVSSVLFQAADAGSVDRLRLLFRMKVDANATDEHGNTFLHCAAMKNHASIIQEFHKQIDIDSVNKDGNTALHEACYRGHYEAVMTLINVKAMANIRNQKGETALHLSAYSRVIQPHTVLKMIEYVIKTHPWECLNITDNEGNNPLHIAAKHARPDVLWEFRFVRFKDADIDGNIALHEAVRPGEPEVLEMMLDIYDAMKRDCDINHRNKKMQTCLLLAASEGFLECVKRLMLFGADISIADEKGNTPLHMLTYLTVVNPNQRDRYLEIMDVLMERAPQWYCSRSNMKMSEIKDQVALIKREAIHQLISKVSNREDLTVLDLACRAGASEVIKRLVAMEEVMAFKVGRFTRYDITGFTPRTNSTLGGFCAKSKVSPRPSSLEWLLANSSATPVNAARVFEFEPFNEIETAYGSVAARAYAVVMIMHIIYMSLFSWAGITLLSKSLTHPGVRSTDGPTLVTYIVVPLEPALILIYNVYKLVVLCCMGEFSIRAKLSKSGAGTILSTLLSVSVALVYSFFVIIWVITYATDAIYIDYFLSIALCLGWMFTVVFTRGFRVINYYWRLLQIMIIRDVFKFLFLYLFVLLAFSFAFHSLFQVSADVVTLYPNPLYTIFLLFNMMIGMEYVFDEDKVIQGLFDANRDSVFIKVLYILYMILATIILLNLLIAMMNDSYQEILKRQQVSWRIESVQLGVDVEKSFPLTFPLFSKVKVTHGFIFPLDLQKRWYIEIDEEVSKERLMRDKMVSTNEEPEALSELKSRMAAMDTKLSDQIQSLKNSLDDVQSLLKNLEQSLVTHKKMN